jgi:hypothetical protein
MRYGTERKKDATAFKNFYYETIYDIISGTLPHEKKAIHLRHLKAKITRLHNNERKKILSTIDDDVSTEEEEVPTLFHYVKIKKRNDARTVTQIQDANNKTQTAPLKIIQVFADHFRKKFEPIRIREESFRKLVESIPKTIPTESHYVMDAPITIDELKQAVRNGKLNKAPGSDGIRHDFFAKAWDMCKDYMVKLLNETYMEGRITETQKRGLIVCIPKTKNPIRVDFRPLTLLNADVKMLTRVLAARIKPLLQDIMHKGQHCGIANTTIIDELETIRDTIATAEYYKRPLCVLSLDFKDAFNKISHTYLFNILGAYGFSTRFQACLREMYTGTTSQTKINGYTSGVIPIHSSIPQGCPLSMALYAICLDLLLHALTKELPGYRRGHEKNRSGGNGICG